jgi:hypothetical protein
MRAGLLLPTFASVVAALVFLAANPARADVIDGDWCRADGHFMSIKGPEIVTPGGTHTHGSYSRHSFTYTVPPADAGAGSTVYMILVNELTVHLRTGASPAAASEAPVEVWRRCAQPTSALETRSRIG